MTHAPAPTPEEIDEKRRAWAMIRAYKALFGMDGARSTLQQIVWDDLKARAGLSAPVFVPARDGSMDTHRAAHTDGRRSLLIEVATILATPTQDEAQPQKPNVIR